MKCLHLFRVFNKTSGIPYNRAIQTGAFNLAKTRPRNLPRRINYEPGTRHLEAALGENSDILEEIEGEEDLADDFNFMNLDKAHDMHEIEQNRNRERLGRIITARRFFKSPPEPSTLTWNERECIKYLNKTDPVQWDVKTLSESFPATPDAIRKVLKTKLKVDPERKKKMDLKVQKNWELLAEGKLQAAPEVLEHLKKFINRREVLLDQIKKADFYLPEVKEQVNWNNGEMSNILVHYEKALERLVHKQEPQGAKITNVESNESISKTKKQRNISMDTDIEETEKTKCLVEPDLLGYEDHYSTDQVKDVKCMALQDKNRTSQESAFSNISKKQFQEKSYAKETEEKKDLSDPHQLEQEDQYFKNQVKDVENTAVKNKIRDSQDTACGNVSKEQPKENPFNEEIENSKDLFDSKKLRREDQYFTNQVKDIENTAFWNKNRTSQEKAFVENEKAPLGGFDIIGRGKVWSSDAYPERIKVPLNKRGSGLTFRVKDCYYDDDGEFLYRVPGMVK